jgi:hypothetical protein
VSAERDVIRMLPAALAVGFLVAWPPRIAYEASLPVFIAAGAVAAVQVAGAVAGRGRPMPGARLGGLARLVIAGAIIALFFVAELSRNTRVEGVTLGVAPIFLGICALSGRVDGRSAALAGFVTVRVILWSADFRGVPRDYRFIEGHPAAVIGAALAILIALRVLRFDRARLARAGITTWAAADLALLPWIAALFIRVTFGLKRIRLAELPFLRIGADVWLPIAMALAMIGALIYLDRRLPRPAAPPAAA